MKKLLRKVFAITVVCVLTVCICIPVNASAFVNSVEQTVPTASGSFTDDKGNTGNVIFTDKSGNTAVPEEDVILEITDLSQAPTEELEEIKEMLESAESQIAAAKSVAELVPELEEVVESLNQANPDAPGVEVNDMVVLSLFDVSLVKLKDNKKQSVIGTPAGNSATFEISFPFDIPEFYILIHEQSPGKWVVEENVEKIDKRTLRCTVNGFSPFALVVNKSDSEDLEVDWPQQGFADTSENEYALDSNSHVWILPIVGAVAAILVFVAMRIRKKVD